jgi:hypothetical protein
MPKGMPWTTSASGLEVEAAAGQGTVYVGVAERAAGGGVERGPNAAQGAVGAHRVKIYFLGVRM